MFKKIISAAAALSMVAAFAVAPVSAADIAWEDVDPIVTYQLPPRYDTAEATGSSTENLIGWGLTHPGMWTVIYTPTPGSSDITSDWEDYNDMGYDVADIDKSQYAPALRFSLRNAVNGEQELANFNFAADTKHGISDKKFNGSAYLLEMDFSAAIRKGSMRYDFIGDTGTFASMYITWISSGKAQISFGDSSKTIDIATSSNKEEIDYLKLYIDIDNQTCSAWAATRGEDGTYKNPMVVSSGDLMVADQPFKADNVTEFTGIKLIANNTQNDRMDISILKISDLTDNNIVFDAANNLTIPQTTYKDLTLPSILLGADIKWESSNPDVISNDGKVTPSSTETAVNMTATISRGTVSTEKSFTVTIPAIYPVPDDGVWANEELNYTSVAEIPFVAESDFTPQYLAWETKSSTPVYDSKEAVSDTSTSGYAYLEDGKLVILKGSDSESGDARYRYACNKQHDSGIKVVEWKFTPVNNPADIQMNIASQDNYTGVDTIYYRSGKISTYQSDENTTVSGDVTLTAVINIDDKTYSLYVNGSLLDDNITWRDTAQTNIGRLGITVATKTAENAGIAIDYIRFIENTDYYASFCFSNENIQLPSEIAADTASIDLPTTGEYNNTITWQSDNEAISTDGTVTHGTQDVQVQLTPTYTNKVTNTTQEGDPITVTVKARTPETTVGEALTAINPNLEEGSAQAAVGFMYTFKSQNTGFTPEIGFKLSYTGKNDMTVTIPASVDADNIAAGIILTYDEEDGFVLSNLTVKPYITE